MQTHPPPRLYAQVATAAPVALVFRRGPGGWWHLLRWHLEQDALEPGAWFRGTLYPRRCDLSPDGALLSAFAGSPTSAEFLGEHPWTAYLLVSKAPWLFALAAWHEGGTWSRGHHFAAAGEAGAVAPADAGDASPLRARGGLAPTPVVQYAAERRRGWEDDPRGEPRDPRRDPWDERRQARLVKARPGGGARLVLEDQGLDLRAPRIEGRSPAYAVELGRRTVALPEAAWADWDARGRLLVATRDARLELRDGRAAGLALRGAHDLSALRPDPRPAPGWARRW
ncbi:hypothetical protein [Anaeromyxobacter sp. PSR-1]|uniref:hypothetical protein n=1 Tax=Anaeromyxobacter sp. PSR-1 TaxID=1300915 RepID=UPI0005E1291B|nr:hypothetical protein [Anaeromyxobacter sp. PSR-1]GAO05127.1 hypothetical protein PSR1_04034 [Anaeromyxobacter sp. PSR-1]